jgi:hypothetical protein
MGALGRLRNRWTARRMRLAMDQIESARDTNSGLSENLSPDAFTGSHYMGMRALGRLLNPKAKSHTEWRGD